MTGGRVPSRWPHALWLTALTACQAPQPPQPPVAAPAHAELVRSQLVELVGPQQPPCGAVRQYARHGRLDYLVECESGRAYRVHVSADGHVVVRLDEQPSRAASAPR